MYNKNKINNNSSLGCSINDRIMASKFELNNKSLVSFNIYIPCWWDESYSADVGIISGFVRNLLDSLVDRSCNVMIAGGFNINQNVINSKALLHDLNKSLMIMIWFCVLFYTKVPVSLHLDMIIVIFFFDWQYLFHIIGTLLAIS